MASQCQQQQACQHHGVSLPFDAETWAQLLSYQLLSSASIQAFPDSSCDFGTQRETDSWLVEVPVGYAAVNDSQDGSEVLREFVQFLEFLPSGLSVQDCYPDVSAF